MFKSPALVAASLFTALSLATTLTSQTTDAASQPTHVSKVRIVRLSEVKGQVQLDRNTGRGFESVMANFPIVEQSRLRTGEGVAEVEFEDNSTLRLGPDSVVEFPRLDRLPSGATASSVHLVKGMAYVSLVKTPGNEFTLLFGQKELALPPASHIRLQLDGTEARLAVLDGIVKVDGAAGSEDVPRKKTVTFDLLNHEQPSVAKNVLPEATDEWDQTSTKYHAGVASFNGSNGSPYAYGLNDMSYYGGFMDAGGCGSMWRPYFASASWEPYTNGVYAYYPGAGYSWVSPYPWGWTPYHTGSWSFCPGTGWGWQPGGLWNGLNNIAAMSPSNGGLLHMQPAPVRPPRPGEVTMTAVSLKPLVRSDVASQNSFVFRRDSAGLGIPRDTLGKLNKFSEHAISRGTASTAIYMSEPTSIRAEGREGGARAGIAPTTIHRGYAPMNSSSAIADASSSSVSSRGTSVTSSSRSAPVASAPSGGSSSSGASHH